MEGALGWISEIVQWLGRFIPRLLIVRSTHGGVRFRHGKHAELISPGIVWYWPLLTEVAVIPVARQTLNLVTQSLLTKDAKQVAAGAVVVFAIGDPVAALSRNWDISDTISDVTMTAIAEVVTGKTLDDLLSNLTGTVQADLTRVTRRKLKPYGVRVYRTAMTDFSLCSTINVNGSPLVLPAG